MMMRSVQSSTRSSSPIRPGSESSHRTSAPLRAMSRSHVTTPGSSWSTSSAGSGSGWNSASSSSLRYRRRSRRPLRVVCAGNRVGEAECPHPLWRRRWQPPPIDARGRGPPSLATAPPERDGDFSQAPHRSTPAEDTAEGRWVILSARAPGELSRENRIANDVDGEAQDRQPVHGRLLLVNNACHRNSFRPTLRLTSFFCTSYEVEKQEARLGTVLNGVPTPVPPEGLDVGRGTISSAGPASMTARPVVSSSHRASPETACHDTSSRSASASVWQEALEVCAYVSRPLDAHEGCGPRTQHERSSGEARDASACHAVLKRR